VLAFTLTRMVFNTAHRMIYPFLAVLGRGLGINLQMLSIALTTRSLVGLAGLFLAPIADSRGRKTGMLTGLMIFTAGLALIVLRPSYPVLLLTLSLIVIGKFIFDPAMQAYIGDRVPYERRGRVLAFTELGWSVSFILGVPLMGFLIARFGWIAPFPVLALAGALALLTLYWLIPKDPAPARDRPGPWSNYRIVFSSPAAILGLSISMLLSAANEVINVIFGVWMEDSFGLKIATLGAAAALIGLAELGGEALTAGLTDRLGKPRAVALGAVLNCLAALALPLFGRSLAGAAVGLFFFYITFEFTIVSSIPMMTEILPSARATLMASSMASHSLGRALGALLAAALYAQGIYLNSLAAIVLNLLGLLCLRFLVIKLAEQDKKTAPSL
jgi:predicted MFS family arabinose efflux permease